MKILTLLRHAKAVAAELGEADHGRRLNARGREAAAEIGRATASNPPELVLCSTAERTRQTYACVVQAWPHPGKVLFEAGLYMAEAGTLARRLETLPAEIHRVWLIGHNPGLHDLAFWLARDARNAQDFTNLCQFFPTAARASFTLESDDWSQLLKAPITISAYVTPPRPAISF